MLTFLFLKSIKEKSEPEEQEEDDEELMFILTPLQQDESQYVNKFKNREDKQTIYKSFGGFENIQPNCQWQNSRQQSRCEGALAFPRTRWRRIASPNHKVLDLSLQG